MRVIRDCLGLLSCLVLAFLLRAYNLSHSLSFHPDERHMVMTTMRLSLEDMNPHFFAYGSLPFYLTWAVSNLLGFIWPYLKGYDGVFMVGRGITIFFGLVAILLTFFLAKRILNSALYATLAALLLAFNTLHLQLSRFYTVDGFLTTFVVAFFLALTVFLQTGARKYFFAAATCLGLALATKISALSLFVPLLASILLAPSINLKRDYLSAAITFGAAVLVALITFLICEPYALLDFKTFLANNQEQIRMVVGEWRPPYTIQYVGTTPFLYHLDQMANFTIGWPVMILSVVGLLFTTLKSYSKFNAIEFVILLWVAVFFFSTAGNVVKFPRYLLPLYPFLFIFAAYGLNHILTYITNGSHRQFYRLLPQIACGALAAISIFSALAFVNIYSQEHPYRLASTWIFSNIPKGAKILGVHWDDKLPLHLPGLSPHEYGYRYEGADHELPIYERDSEEKKDIIVTRLANSDYLIFPTQRIPGSIPRIPEELYFSNAFLTALYKGELGYELVASFKNYPALLGFTLNTDTADESLSVYDHPKVTIFKNSARLNKEQLLSKISSLAGSGPLLTREQILLASANLSSGAAPNLTLVQVLLAPIQWFLVVLTFILLGRLIWTRLSPAPAFSDFIDDHPLLSLLLSLWLLWLALSCGIVNFAASTIWLTLFPLFTLAWLLLFHRNKLQAILCSDVVIVLTLSFFAFTAIQSLYPEVGWGERPMDFTFLNYFIRDHSLPPYDPWAAGSRMQYYYLGSFMMALIHLFSGVDSAIGYNLGMSSVGALLLTTLYGLFKTIRFSPRAALLAALAVTLLSNSEWLYLWLVKGMRFGFDLFWATTRLYTSPQITEYPQWALIFSDLHAHVIAMPFLALTISLAFSLISTPATSALADAALSSNTRTSLLSQFFTHRFAIGLSFGSLIAFNSWDAITTGFVIFITLVLSAIWHGQGQIKSTLQNLFCNGLDGLAILLIGVIAFAPFLLGSLSGAKLGTGWVVAAEFNSLQMLLRHLAVWLIPAVLAGGFLIVRNFSADSTNYIKVLLAVCFAISVPLLLLAFSLAHGVSGHPYGLLTAALVCAMLGGLISATSKRDISHLVMATCLIGAAWLISFAELRYLMDRMNTSFKLYVTIWMVLGIAGVCGVMQLLAIYQKSVGLARKAALLTLVPIALLGTISVTGSIANYLMMFNFNRFNGPRPTLNGMAYLEQKSPQEYELYRWIRANIKGAPVVLEAHGPSYREFTRVAMNTGLPTLLGWDHHVKQRGLSEQNLRLRKQHLEAIYDTRAGSAILPLLSRYNIELIVVGELERESYSAAGLQKFAAQPELFKPIFKNNKVTLYATILSPYFFNPPR